MASAAFTINSTAVPCAKAVTYGGAVALALSSTVGVRSIAWSIAGNSKSTLTNPTITPAGSPSGATATCTHVADPGDGGGAAFLVRCDVTDDSGNVLTQYGVFGTAANSGIIPACAGEQMARDATYGWLTCINTPVTSPPAPISHTSGIGITLASVADPGSAPAVSAVRIRAKTDATDGDVLMAETSVTDDRILTDRRNVGGVQVSEYGDTCTTTDNSTWVTLLSLPIRGGISTLEANVACTSTPGVCFKLHAAYGVSAVSSILEIGGTSWAATHANVRISDPGSGNYLLIQVVGPAVASHTWEGYAIVYGDTV